MEGALRRPFCHTWNHGLSLPRRCCLQLLSDCSLMQPSSCHRTALVPGRSPSWLRSSAGMVTWPLALIFRIQVLAMSISGAGGWELLRAEHAAHGGGGDAMGLGDLAQAHAGGAIATDRN